MSKVICYKCNFSMSVLNHKPKRCPACGFADSERCKEMLEDMDKTTAVKDVGTTDKIAAWLGVKK